jgi:paraquat-inducible protein B
LEVPPVIRSDVPGKEYVLEADRLGSLGPGVPIYFRGIEVGEIMGFELRPDARGVHLPIFIKAPYDALVRKETVFWNSSGIDIVLNADGIRIRTESAQALLAGGITFETPTSATAVNLAKAGQVFRLFRDREMQEDESLAEIIPVLARFDGSVRGLKVGAPIEFRGIRIGTVAAITFESDPETLSLGIAVLLNIEPERIRPPTERPAADPYATLEKLVAKGMRAQLQSGNLLTGQLLVNWDFFPDSAPATIKRDGLIPEMPTIPSDFEQISGSVNTVLAKLSALPMKELIEDVRKTVRAAGKLAEAPELQSSLASLDRSLSAVERVVNDVDGEIGPLLNSLKQTSDKAEVAVEQAAKALASTDEIINRDSEGREMLLDALRELASAAQSINSLATYLERHPEALIQGKAGGATR